VRRILEEAGPFDLDSVTRIREYSSDKIFQEKEKIDNSLEHV
jgi:hypothetical protein